MSARRKEPRASKRAHVCNVCSQAFMKSEHLTRHARIHTQERPFRCGTCGRSYARRDTLLRHARSHVAGDGDNHSTSDSSRAAAAAAAAATTVAADDDSEFHDVSPNRPEDHSAQFGDTTMNGDNDHISPGTSATTNPYFPMHGTSMVYPPVPGTTTQQYPELDFNESGMNWIPGEEFQVQEDFNLSAFNASVADIINHNQVVVDPRLSQASDGQGEFASNAAITSGDRLVDHHSNGDAAVLSPEDSTSRTRGVWSPHPADAADGQRTDSLEDMAPNVDDDYRNRMKSSLRPSMPSDALPSTDFLNQSVNLYLSRFNTILPVIHLPTFRPSETNVLLLLSICSVGGLLIGSTSAALHGAKIFENLNRAVLASWRPEGLTGAALLPLFQSSVIGQTFALLSKKSAHLITGQAFHGTLLVLHRYLLQYYTRRSRRRAQSQQYLTNEQSWEIWIHEQVMIRLWNALQIHDAQLSVMTHRPPAIRANRDKTDLYAASSHIFYARSAQAWKSSLVGSDVSMLTDTSDNIANPHLHCANNDPASFSVYAELHTHLSTASESHYLDCECFPDARVTQSLLGWYAQHRDKFEKPRAKTLKMESLWHAAFVNLTTNLDMIEQALGREGPEAKMIYRQTALQWASSINAKRAVLHAYCVLKHLSRMMLSEIPAIHVPLALFQIGLVFYAFSAFNSSAMSVADDRDQLVAFPEIDLLTRESSLVEHDWVVLSRDYSTRTCKNRTCDVVDHLRRNGPWGISAKYANTLDELIQYEAE